MVRKEYQILSDFIKSHPQIVINKSEISIPSEVREEFYRLFDDVRRAVVDEHFANLPIDPVVLSEHYLRIEQEIVNRLGLERIAMPVDLASFLRNPREGLTRVLYTKLFDLLQGKMELADFEQQAEQDLKSAASDLYRLGYEMWAALALINMLDPDQGFFVDLDADYKPVLAELKEIAFGRQAHHPTIRIPEFVIRSRRLDQYVAVKMAMTREISSFIVPYTPPVRPRKKTGDTSQALDSRVMLLYLNVTPEDIPVVAEIYDRKLTCPDFMIEFITEGEFNDPASLSEVRGRLEMMNPKLGMGLLLIGTEPAEKPEGIADNMHVVAAGFDSSRMEPLLERLV